MTETLESFFDLKLSLAKKKQTLRTLPAPFSGKIDFVSHDYLGLKHILPTQKQNNTSRSGSRLLAGNHPFLEQVESEFASFFQAESAVLFNSGFDANIGFWSTVPQRRDLVLFDKKIHASIRSGLLQSAAKSLHFEHNCLESLQQKFEHTSGKHERVFLAIESMYSMDGDLAPLKEMVEWCEKNKVILVVDEAHGGGVSYPTGRGWCVDLDLHARIPFRLITLGKGLGLHGAIWLGSEQFKQFALNFIPSFIYTTALPPELFHVNWPDYFSRIAEQLPHLHTLCSWVHHELPQLQSKHVYSPIKWFACSSAQDALHHQAKCQNRGIIAQAVRHPTVPQGEEGLRICLRADHNKEEIQTLVNTLQS